MRRYAYPLLLLALLGLILAPLILRPGHLLYPQDGHRDGSGTAQATDLTITHWPAVAFNVHTLRQHGQIPLWRTTLASGGPWLANPQSWLLYPLAWLFFLLPINPTFNLLLVAHLLLAGLTTYAFGRRALDLNPPGAALAGLAFASAPWLSAQLAAGHVNVALALAWLPLALLGAHLAAARAWPRGAILACIAWSAALLNHVQMAAFAAALSLAWFLLALTRTQRPRQRLIFLLAAPALTLLLCAALLLPLAEALPYLNRADLTLEEAGFLSLSWPQLLTTLVPTYGGEPEHVVYVGLPVAVLAVVGLLLKSDRAAWFLAAVAALAVLWALGTHAPLFPLLVRWVPGLDWLRVPPRAWVLVTFSLALLAGRGLDALIRPHLPGPARRRLTLVGLGTLVAGLILAGGLALLFRPPPPAAWVLAALAALTAAALLFRARGSLRPGLTAVGLLLLVAADLGLVRAAWTEMRAPAEALAWGAEAAEFLAEQPGRFRVYSPGYSLPQHTAVEHGLSLANGVDPFQLAHYADFLARAGGYSQSGYSPTLPPVLDDTSAAAAVDARLLGLLNVGYVAADFELEAEGLASLGRFGETRVYENEQVLSRAFVVAAPPGEGDVNLAWPIAATPARIARYTPNRVVVEVDPSTGGSAQSPGTPRLLVLSEVWYPGWQARVDGRPVTVRRVEGVLRGVPLDAGRHTVEFVYQPWAAWAGLLISAGTVLALALYSGLQRRAAHSHAR